MRSKAKTLVYLLALAASFMPACSTWFVGDAHITFTTCARLCRRDAMRIQSLIHHGEWSSSCVCTLPERPAR